LGIPETTGGATPGKGSLGDALIVVAFLVVLLACVGVVFLVASGRF
jgi:hypothetical protein